MPDTPPTRLPEVRPAPEQRTPAELSHPPEGSSALPLLARSDSVASALGCRRGGVGPDRTTVFVLGSDPTGLEAVLRDSGFECGALDAPQDIRRLDPERSVVVAVDGDAHPGRAPGEVDGHARSSGVPWLPVSAYDGAVVHVGPLFVPGETACFACLRARLGAVPGYASLYDPIVAGAGAVPMPHALRTWAASITALLLMRWLGHHDAQLPGALFTLDAATLEVRRSRVFRVPRCPVCGS